jgi:hypothetical protein
MAVNEVVDLVIGELDKRGMADCFKTPEAENIIGGIKQQKPSDVVPYLFKLMPFMKNFLGGKGLLASFMSFFK